MKILNADVTKEAREKLGQWTAEAATRDAALKSDAAKDSSQSGHPAAEMIEKERVAAATHTTLAKEEADKGDHETAYREHIAAAFKHANIATNHGILSGAKNGNKGEAKHEEAKDAHERASDVHRSEAQKHWDAGMAEEKKKQAPAKDHEISQAAHEATEKAHQASKSASGGEVGAQAAAAHTAAAVAEVHSENGNHKKADRSHADAHLYHKGATEDHEAKMKSAKSEKDRLAHRQAADQHFYASSTHFAAMAAHRDIHSATEAAPRNRAPILNRDFTHPEDGWYHIEPKGEHPNRVADIVQVVDDAACEAIANRFNADAAAGKLSHGKEMLIDHEHFKHDANKETRAFGWLTELQNREDGLYGKIRWSSTGKEAVDGGDYRFFSTEYDPKNLTVLNKETKTARPTVLDGLTLTNQPNNRGGRPITNSDRNPANKPADNPKQKSMKNIAAALGLSEGASEGDILGEVSNLRNRIVQQDAEQIDADLAAAGVKAEAVINRLKPVLAAMGSREERRAFLAEVVTSPSAGQRKLQNREGNPPSKEETKDRDAAVKIANRAAELRKGCPTLTQASAYIQAKAEIEG